MGSTAAAEDYEHWPDDSKYWSKDAGAAPGYDDNNGLHSHSYLAGKDPSPAKSPSPAPEEGKKSDEASAEAAIVAPTFFAPQPLYIPQPSSIAHPSNPQFYSHPQPMYGAFPPQGYYTYAQPGPPVVVAAPPTAPAKPRTPKPAAAVTSAPAPANYHMYTPGFYGAAAAVAVAVEEPKQPQPNTWQGRTKAQVEEDNMKFGKTEGAWDKRKIAPVGLADDQMCWVIEIDGSHTLRSYLTIKEFAGEWKMDPRFEGSYYFVREEEEEEKEAAK